MARRVTSPVYAMGACAALLLVSAMVAIVQRPAEDELLDVLPVKATPFARVAPPAAKRSGTECIDPELRRAGADESWWRTVSADLERQEYAAKPSEEGLQAANVAQRLHTTFGERGIEVVPSTRKDIAPAWRFAWETIGFGRRGRMEQVPLSTPSSEQHRVTYQRQGWSEWYENTALGLEQGFTIERRPAGEGALRIAGKVPEGLTPQVRDDGAVDFMTSHGACAIRYGELHAWDAKHAELRSELVVAGAELAIVVDDEGAEYPITVDPLMTSPAWTAEGNQPFSSLGVSVSTAGDVNGDGYSDVIVGALFYDNAAGRAFVYHGSAAGLATSPAWSAQSDQATTMFAAATAGDVNGDGFSDVILGIADYDNGQLNEGRALAYHGSAAGLGVSPAWTAESNQASSEFGFSVATAGDVNRDGYADVIVGARFFDNGQVNEGGAFFYEGSASGLGATPARVVESNQQAAFMGTSVATAGDVNGDWYPDVIVGAPLYGNGQAGEGRAFVYLGSSSGLAPTATWTVESDQTGGELGNSVSTAGDVNGDGYADVIVGVHNFDNGQNNEGKALVYQGSAGGLTTSFAWSIEGDQQGAQFGIAVATAGDVNGDGFSDVIVGAHNYGNGQAAEGRGYVYQGAATGLATTPSWTGESNQIAASFGNSVGTAGDVNGDGFSDVIVGAPFYESEPGQEDEGRAYVYHGAGGGLATTSGWTVTGNQALARLGYSVATAGDVNGDGFSDVIVGAPDYSNEQSEEGRAFAYHGSAAGLSITPAWIVESNQANTEFGSSVATAGDVNGDGFSDVIVGAWFYTNGETFEGRAFVYHGSETGLETEPAWTGESDQSGALFGISVATAGDVNGDGFSDVIVGAYNYDHPDSLEGRAFVYQGSAAGLSTAPVWSAEGDQDGAVFGRSVATAGDVNGDGFSDVIVGAFGYENGEIAEGRAFVYHGSEAGLATVPAWTAESNQVNAWFGNSVATAGDVNGDGFSDVIVGAPRYDNSENDEGQAFVYHGSGTGLSTTPDWTGRGAQGGVQFGSSVATTGDVNGDGFSDIVVGAHLYSNGQGGEGRAFVYHGSAVGLGTIAAWTAEANQGGAQLGVSASAAGDVNGDGVSEVIVGAPRYSGSVGASFIYYGNGGDGLERIPGQVRTDDSAPIWVLGNSDSESAFRLKVLGRTAAGRGNVSLQCEVKPAGVPFDGTGLVTGFIRDTGAPTNVGSAVLFSELVDGLTPETLYHWRLRVISESPFFPRTPWMWLPYNGATEADVRTGEAITAVGNDEAPPAADLWLAPATPNPFNPRTTLSFLLPTRGKVRLAIHDVQGRLVRVLDDEVLPAGPHAIEWDGRDSQGHELATGVYLSRLEAGGEIRSGKLALVK